MPLFCHTCNPELCCKSLVSILGSKCRWGDIPSTSIAGIFLICLKKWHSSHVSEFHICEDFIFEYKNEIQPPVWRHFIFAPCQCPCLTPVITIPLHRYPLSPLLAFTVTAILLFLFQSKSVNRIIERKLSAGYLYAAPRQKCRFKETAICKHEGSRCCTIKGNLKERGRW